MFKLGKKVSKGVVEFVDKRRTDELEKEATRDCIFDDFIIPGVTTGVGFDTGKFSIDNDHPFVSLMTNIVPSPDWFIGVDSLMVCIFLVSHYDSKDLNLRKQYFPYAALQ